MVHFSPSSLHWFIWKLRLQIKARLFWSFPVHQPSSTNDVELQCIIPKRFTLSAQLSRAPDIKDLYPLLLKSGTNIIIPILSIIFIISWPYWGFSHLPPSNHRLFRFIWLIISCYLPCCGWNSKWNHDLKITSKNINQQFNRDLLYHPSMKCLS